MKNIYARFQGIKSFLHFQRPRTFLSGNARSYFLFSSHCYSFIACKPVFQILSTRRTGFQEFFGTLGHANNNLLCEIKKSFFDTLNILCSVFFHPPLDTLFDSPFLSALIALFRGSSRSIFLILFDTLFFGGEIIFEIDWKISNTLTRFKFGRERRKDDIFDWFRSIDR